MNRASFKFPVYCSLFTVLSCRLVLSAEPGLIRGLVRFPGETPPPAMIVPDGDSACPTAIPQEHLLVRQSNRGLKNVLVMLEKESERMKPVPPVTVKLVGCRLAPRMRWVPVGTGVWLENADGADHVLVARTAQREIFRVPLPAGSPRVRRPLIQEGLVRIECARHLWERAWIYVSGHPYVSVTDESGRFEFAVPPGSYLARAWHEGWTPAGKDNLGRQEFQPMEQYLRIKVRADEPADALFEHLEPTF